MYDLASLTGGVSTVLPVGVFIAQNLQCNLHILVIEGLKWFERLKG